MQTTTILNYLRSSLLTNTLFLATAPVLMAQGYGLRRRAVLLPGCPPPHEGLIPGAAPSLRLIVLGESTAAGVGAACHAEGLTGQIAAALAERTGRAVAWRAVARPGERARRARRELVPLLAGDRADLVVLALGVNDVLRLTPPALWLYEMAALVRAIQAQVGDAPVLIAGLPRIDHFPLLPMPLRGVLGRRAAWMDRLLATLPQRVAGVHYCRTQTPPPSMFAPDGFHPNAAGYAAWGAALAGYAVTHVPGMVRHLP